MVSPKSLLTPADRLKYDEQLPAAMEELAQKDVPTGQKYKIVEDSFIPSDWTFRDAWEIAESELTDGVGA